jgi:hypothetical protein
MLMDEQLSVAAELLRRLVVDRREAGVECTGRRRQRMVTGSVERRE